MLVLFFFLRCLGTLTSSWSINTQKKDLANIQPSWPHAWSITHIYSAIPHVTFWRGGNYCIELQLISQCKLCGVGEYANKREKFLACLLHIPVRDFEFVCVLSHLTNRTSGKLPHVVIFLELLFSTCTFGQSGLSLRLTAFSWLNYYLYIICGWFLIFDSICRQERVLRVLKKMNQEGYLFWSSGSVQRTLLFFILLTAHYR